MRDNIDRALGLNDDEQQPEGKFLTTEVLPDATDVTTTEVHDDFEYARRNMRTLIDNGLETIKDIENVALQSESPRAYEVYAKIIDTLVVANEKLLTVAVKKAEAEKAAGGAPSGVINNTQNNIYVGSPADILKAMKPQEQD